MTEQPILDIAAARVQRRGLPQRRFVQQLIKQLRAQDTNGTWDNKTDLQLLKPYIHTAEERRALPILGDPDPETLWHLEIFYNAIAVAIERETGQMVSPMMKMSHEGFGRMVLIGGPVGGGEQATARCAPLWLCLAGQAGRSGYQVPR
jgi:hypothetical protein